MSIPSRPEHITPGKPFLDVSGLKITIDQSKAKTTALLKYTIGGAQHTVRHQFEMKVSDEEASNFMINIVEQMSLSLSRIPPPIAARRRLPKPPTAKRAVQVAQENRIGPPQLPLLDRPAPAAAAPVQPTAEEIKTTALRHTILAEVLSSEKVFVRNQSEAVALIALVLLPYYTAQGDTAAIQSLDEILACYKAIAKSSFIHGLEDKERLDLRSLLLYINNANGSAKFATYCDNIEKIVVNWDHLNKLAADIPLEELAKHNLTNSLAQTFITAVQRIPRYALFLKEIEKTLNARAHPQLDRASQIVKERGAHANEEKGKMDKKMSIQTVGDYGTRVSPSKKDRSQKYNAQALVELCNIPKVQAEDMRVISAALEQLSPDQKSVLAKRLSKEFTATDLPTVKNKISTLVNILAPHTSTDVGFEAAA